MCFRYSEIALFRHIIYFFVIWRYHIPFSYVVSLQRGALFLLSTAARRYIGHFFLWSESSFEEPRGVCVQVQEVFGFMSQRQFHFLSDVANGISTLNRPACFNSLRAESWSTCAFANVNQFKIIWNQIETNAKSSESNLKSVQNQWNQIGIKPKSIESNLKSIQN